METCGDVNAIIEEYKVELYYIEVNNS